MAGERNECPGFLPGVEWWGIGSKLLSWQEKEMSVLTLDIIGCKLVRYDKTRRSIRHEWAAIRRSITLLDNATINLNLINKYILGIWGSFKRTAIKRIKNE